MTEQEFITLFELEEIYGKYKNKIPFCFSLHDRLTGLNSAIYFSFKKNHIIKIHVECIEFNTEVQHIELFLNLKNGKIELKEDAVFKNEIFPFLNFNTNLDSSLQFLANFINKILIPKYQLMGGVSTY